MANLTDIITQELATKDAREEFAREARKARDYYDGLSASQYRVWNRIAIAADLLVSSAPK